MIKPGESDPRLPHGIPDAVLLSAGDRYEELARRVQADYGKLDAHGAIALMTRPVCMTSNIHAVLFAPDTLEFWVANADAEEPREPHPVHALRPERPAEAGGDRRR